MSVTILGAILIPVALGFTVFRPAYLLPLMVISSVFQAGSVANSTGENFEFGLSPFYFVAICIVFRYVLLRLGGRKTQSPRKRPIDEITTLLAIFWVWSLASSFILPRLFDGIAVYDPRGGIDEQFINQTSLHWSASNLAQAVYLTLAIGTVFFALDTVKTRKEVDRLVKSVYIAILIVVVVGFWQQLASLRQWWFPFDFFDSNPAEIQAFTETLGVWQRMTSTFSEPSYAGAFLAAVSSGMIASFMTGSRSFGRLLAVMCVILALLETASTTGYVAVAICMCLLLMFRAVGVKQRLTWSGVKGWVGISAAAFAAGIILYANSDLLEAAGTNTFYKTEGLSFLHRVAADAHALGLTVGTYGLGVGLGSNRPSSLFAALLSTVGIPGTWLFVAMFYKVFKLFPHRSASPSSQMILWAMVGLLLAQILAVPDVTFPALWTLVMLALTQLKTSDDRLYVSHATPVLNVAS